jgi:POT family proton-dependent oligopeptide transporter
MWERFSYYGMRALLVLYMIKALQFSTEKAGSIYGWYTGLVYFTPLIGGYLADRYFGQRMCIMIGGIFIAMGHFTLAVPYMPCFFAALGLLIIGNGFFKPNISTVVGLLYEENDPRRDGGFTIFYMGINLGAFFSPLVCGTLGEKIGWHYGFAAAGVGMVTGLLFYLFAQNRYLGNIPVYNACFFIDQENTSLMPIPRQFSWGFKFDHYISSFSGKSYPKQFCPIRVRFF